jgi:hypothetical protein
MSFRMRFIDKCGSPRGLVICKASDAVVLHLQRTRLLVRVGERRQRFCMGRVAEVDPLIDQPSLIWLETPYTAARQRRI